MLCLGIERENQQLTEVEHLSLCCSLPSDETKPIVYCFYKRTKEWKKLAYTSYIQLNNLLYRNYGFGYQAQ